MAKKDDNAYPKWVYNADGASQHVADADAEKALKGKWYDSPAAVPGYKEPEPANQPGPENKAQTNPMEILPEDHTYRDRVEAQARSLGIEVKEEETLEYLMWKIRMQASS